MIDQKHTVVIDRPVDEVFAYVADPTNEPKWHLDVLEVQGTTDGPLRLGITLNWKVKFLGLKNYRVEATAFEPNRFIEITARDGPVLPTVTHGFEPSGTGTRYTRRVRFQPTGIFRVLEPMLHVMPSPNARWARNLKEILEAS